MATKWEINRAVRASNLTPPSRLIMLTLSDIADAATAEIPEQWTPSLTDLTRETGLARSTVADHLTLLEKEGWIQRHRPDVAAARLRGDRTRYRLTIPEGAPLVRQADYLVRESDQASPAHGLDLVRDADHPSPPGGPNRKTSTTNTTNTIVGDETAATNPAKPKRKRTPDPAPDRLDVERICRHLADRVEAVGFDRPTITKSWRTDARLMLDRDRYTEQQITACIDWATNHHFWRKNIRSMSKLREQYKRLRMDAEEERDRQRNGTRPAYVAPASTAPDRIPRNERCPEHADQRATSCRHCAARAKAGAPR